MNPADRAREYVKGWAETGRLLEEQRWRELASLTDEQALAASNALILAALLTGFGGEPAYIDALLERDASRRADSRQFALDHRVLLAAAPGGVPLDISLAASKESSSGKALR